MTFDEPDFQNAPIDFGSLKFSDEYATFIPSYEYFVVRTPQSSPGEWRISPGFPPDYQAESVGNSSHYVFSFL